jgi:ABC-2 type transport system ATP-binding protein
VPTPHTASLRVSGLSKRYGRVVALEDVSLAVHPGEVLGLIGPNGAGKTTLFECIAGVLPPSSGTVSFEGRALRAGHRQQVLFYLPDAIAPWPSETVAWALEFTIGFFGGRGELRDQVIETLGLASLLRLRIGTLSKGQRKRALLAVGLLSPQPVLLADEPFEGLDLRQSREVAAALRSHAARGRTLFLSIHQIADAARMCDRFVLLSGGRVRGKGTLEELSILAGRQPEQSAQSGTLEEVFLALT